MTLNIKVQVDRLPDVTVGGNLRYQLGIRLSAVIEADTAMPTTVADAHLLQSWLWRMKSDATRSWNAHSPESWVLWHFDGNTMTQLDPAFINIAVTADPDFDTGARGGLFASRIAREVDDIIAAYGIRALEAPVRDGIISARTVYGLVESLTALPSPVPANMQVWTAITLNQEDITLGDEDRFCAIPLFGTRDVVAYEPPALPPQFNKLPDQPTEFVYTSTSGRAARASVFPSLSAKALIPSAQQLIDLSNLQIKTGSIPFESSDWHSNLVIKIAEVLDPSARLMSVLDAVVRNFANTPADPNDTPPRTNRTTLKTDIGAPELDYLRRVLAAVHWKVVGPRTRSSRPTAAPAASFIERLAVRYPELWIDAMLLMLAQAGAESEVGPSNGNIPAVVSRARLADAAGIASMDIPSEQNNQEVLDNEASFKDWLVTHWTTVPPLTPLRGGSYLFAGRTTDANQVSTLTGLIDLMRQPFSSEFRFPLRLSLDNALPAASMEFKLGLAGVPAGVIILLDFVNSTLSVVDGQTHNIESFDDKSVVTLIFSCKEVGPQRYWNLGINIQSPKGPNSYIPIVADITLLAKSGKLLLEVNQTANTAGAFLKIAVAADEGFAGLKSAALKSLQPQGMRSALSLAYSGPVIEKILRELSPSPAIAGLLDELSDKFSEKIKSCIEDEFSRIETEINGKIFANPPGDAKETSHEKKIRQLISNLWAEAKADAMKRATQLVPSDTARKTDHITLDAPPLSFIVDDLQDFDERVDLWTRLAGIGVLIGRKRLDGYSDWWSLNIASLHISQLDQSNNNLRAPLTEANAVFRQQAATWPLSALVDPVPLVITESQGVRNAIIRYESQSIVAEVEKRPQLDPRGQATTVARRPEAYLFPVTGNFPKLPPLTFGRTYRILPYLIAHGGAVPPLLRHNDDMLNPTSWIGSSRSEKGFFSLNEADVTAWTRDKLYLRTVPISAPRISDASRVPGLIDGVASLAAELPFIPPVITLNPGQTVRFFTDRDQVNGLLSCPLNDQTTAGIRIEISEIAPSNSGNLTLKATQGSNTLLDLTINLNNLQALSGAAKVGLRVEVIDANVLLHALVYDADALTEDEPEQKSIQNNIVATQAVSTWQGFMLELTADLALDVVPPSIRWGRKNDVGELLMEGDKAIFPSELVPQSRPISILDGIDLPGRLQGRSSVLLGIKRPSTTMLTYDRWVNGVYDGYGTAPMQTVSNALNDAVARTTSAGGSKSEGVLDDPAVEALVVEVIQLFPTRKRLILKRLDTAFHSTPEAMLGTDEKYRHGVEHALIAITVNSNDQTLPKHAYKMEVSPGCSYEVRVYGAVAEKQLYFAPPNVTNRSRFSPAATASWRDVEIDGKWLHLGAPLVQTIEVASKLMPEIYSDADKLPFYMVMQRPPVRSCDIVALHLVPAIIEQGDADHTQRYQKLRMVDRLALYKQQWSWRGRPHPELGSVTSGEFGEKGTLAPAFREFTDMAFLGRSHDDIGEIREIRISRHHAFGGEAQFPKGSSSKTSEGPFTEPAFLESELNYRGGANLWRFALRATSRYAAMRVDEGSMQRNSHKKSDEPKVNWAPLVVADRTNVNQSNRKPKRPNLMLVIPLTEPMSADGSVPPLLALFNEPMFPLFHAGDSIEALIDVARHPFSGVERVNQVDQEAFHSSWEELESARTKLQVSKNALKNLLKVDVVTDSAAQSRALEQVEEYESLVAIVSAKHVAASGIAMAKGYTANLEDNLVKLVKRLEQLYKDLAAATAAIDDVLIAELSFAITRYEERRVQLNSDIAAAVKAESDGSNDGADARAVGSPYVKYWPEFGPDPVRTGAGADGSPLAMRCDGPIGYSFDFDVQAGRFDHAGLLISPVGESVRPWSMVKMRFRRLEMPELLVGADSKYMLKPYTLPKGDGTPLSIALSSSYPDDYSGNADIHFDTVHEGVALDINFSPSRTVKEVTKSVRISFETQADAGSEFTQIDATLINVNAEQLKLSIKASTRLGGTKAWTINASRGSLVDVRLIVSRQFTMPDVPPRGDVSVRARITPPPTMQESTVGKMHENTWLSVICLPLIARLPHEGIPTVYLQGAGTNYALNVRPVRLSEFTDGVWCQFAAAMSRVVISALVNKKGVPNQRKIEDTVSVTDLRGTKDPGGKIMRIGLRRTRSDENITGIAFTAEGMPEGDAQLEECLYAVVTRYVYDAFDRLRESPISVHPMANKVEVGNSALGDASWIAPQVSEDAPFAEGKGRIRILRALRGKTKKDGGFESETKIFPRDFFGGEVEMGETISMNPFDGAGQVLGISQPFEWE